MDIEQWNADNHAYSKLLEISSLELRKQTMSLYSKIKAKENDDSVEISQEDISKIVELSINMDIIGNKIMSDIQ